MYYGMRMLPSESLRALRGKSHSLLFYESDAMFPTLVKCHKKQLTVVFVARFGVDPPRVAVVVVEVLSTTLLLLLLILLIVVSVCRRFLLRFFFFQSAPLAAASEGLQDGSFALHFVVG